jgi:hypothetical protein
MQRPPRAIADVYLRALAWASLAVACPAAAQTDPAAPVVAAPDGSPVAEAPVAETPVADAVESPEAPTEAPPEEVVADPAPVRTGSGIDGVVVDTTTGETMIEAPVIVVGRGIRVLTDYDGNFSIDLPPGTYTLRSYYDYYEPIRVEDVVVERGARTTVQLSLPPEGGAEAEEVVIEVRAEAGTAASQLRIRRESAAAQDALSAEEMARAPDSTASDAARRAVGVTILDDYLYVRGLGGRYVGTLLNGVNVPNTDPDFPGVQLDIFPSGLLESLTIQKTYTPDMPGDWAGGVLDVATRDYPTDFTLRGTLSLGMNTDTTFRTVYGYEGSPTDMLGFDDGTRSIAAGIPDSRVEAGRNGVTEADSDGLSTLFPNRWALLNRLSLPNITGSLTLGDTVDVGGHLLGFLISVGYRYVEEPREALINTASISPTDPIRDALTTRSIRRRVQLGGLATATLELAEGHSLTTVGLFSQNGTDYTARSEGLSETDGGFPIRTTRFSWLERTLAFGQLLGHHEHVIGPLNLRWQLNASYGARSVPDMRDVLYRQNTRGDWVWRDVSGSGERFYSSLGDTTFGGGIDLDVPIDTVTLRLGGLLRHGERNFDTRRFAWQYGSGIPSDGRLLSPQDLFDPARIGELTTLVERTRDDDSYDGFQDLAAGYLMAEWRPVSSLRLIGGSRLEGFRQVVISSSPFGSGNETPPSTHRTDLDPMPALAAVWEPVTGMFLRASYGGTVGRPQLRELAPFLFQDFTRRRNILGNPDLDRTYIHNFDLRWEWFPSAEDVISVSLFAKVLEAPIESVVVNDAGDVTFGNIAGADNLGAEFEARLNFGTLTPELSFLTFGGNLTLVYSRARLTPDQQMVATNAERPLAGQAPFAINVSLGIEPPDTGLSFWIYYNVLGPRLEDVGRLMLPDTYRQPQHLLDLTVAWEIDPHVSLRATASNLLHPPIDLTVGEVLLQQVQPGTTVTVGLTLTN